jgi:hypothetical protein
MLQAAFGSVGNSFQDVEIVGDDAGYPEAEVPHQTECICVSSG